MIQIEMIQQVALMTIDHPPVNALSPELRKEFVDKLNVLADEKDVWTVIVTGSGENFFAAGGDVPGLLNLDRDSGMKRVQVARAFYGGVAGFKKPVIAAINGLCLGGGLELALACDIRIAAEHAKMGLPEVGLGIFPGAGGTQRLPRAIGPGWAKYLLFTGETIDARKALEIGLVQAVVASECLKKAVLDLAEKINSRGPLAVRAAKELASKAFDHPLETGLDLENQVFSEVCVTQDAREGVTAFLEKRKPLFKAE